MTFCLSLLVGVCLPQDGWTESFPGLLAGWMEGRRREMDGGKEEGAWYGSCWNG